MSGLVHLTAARQALASATTVPELKTLRDQAAAIQDYLKRQQANFEDQNRAAELKLRCERRLGELLRDSVQHQGGRPNSNGTLPFRGLPEGVTKMQSSRWQRAASVPEVSFEKWIASTLAAGDELTSAGLLAFAPVAIFNAEKELELATGGCDGGDVSGPEDEPSGETNPYVEMVYLYFSNQSKPPFVAQCKALMNVFGTDNLTDTVAACVAWLHSKQQENDRA